MEVSGDKRRAAGRVPGILMPWLMLRIVLSIIALSASTVRPNTPLEKTVQLWPVSEPGAWTQRVFLEPWRHWDVEYYENIAARGYRQDDGTLQFHPLYPWAGRFAGFLFAGNVTAGLLAVNGVCGLLFLLVFRQLAMLDFPPEDSRRAAILFLHAPVAFILFTAYSEGMFLLFSALLFLLARRGSWWLAGSAGALAALTRQQGVFLIVPLAWELWEWCGRDVSKLLRQWRSVLSVLMVPAGLVLWLLYRALKFGDIVFDLYNPGTWIYGLLISPDASRVVAEQRFTFPWSALAEALASLQWSTVFDVTLGALFVALFIGGSRFLWRLRKSYYLYAGLILLVSFSYNTGPPFPYMGLPRHCLLAFPLFLPLAVWGRKPHLETLFLAIGFLGMAVLTYSYAAQIFWVP